MANTTDPKAKKPIPAITDADIEALETVLDDLKKNARAAQTAGNLTTFRVYQKIVKMVSPEVVRAQARKERQDLARMGKDARALADAQQQATPVDH